MCKGTSNSFHRLSDNLYLANHRISRQTMATCFVFLSVTLVMEHCKGSNPQLSCMFETLWPFMLQQLCYTDKMMEIIIDIVLCGYYIDIFIFLELQNKSISNVLGDDSEKTHFRGGFMSSLKN